MSRRLYEFNPPCDSFPEKKKQKKQKKKKKNQPCHFITCIIIHDASNSTSTRKSVPAWDVKVYIVASGRTEEMAM
jgi:hypothetical protein